MAHSSTARPLIKKRHLTLVSPQSQPEPAPSPGLLHHLPRFTVLLQYGLSAGAIVLACYLIALLLA